MGVVDSQQTLHGWTTRFLIALLQRLLPR